MDTTAEEAPTLQAVYPGTVYEVGMLGWHFAAIHAAWPHLLVLAILRAHDDEDPEARVAKGLRLLEEPTIYFARDRDWQQWYRALDPVHGEPPPAEETIGDLAERELTVLRAPQLTFERITLDSPLEITIAAAGTTGVVIYAFHLLCAFLRDPERIGGWLPRLVTGWHKARRDASVNLTTKSITKITQAIQLIHRHSSSSAAGRSGFRIGTAYAAKNTIAAIISGHSVARSQRHTSTVLAAAVAVMSAS